MKVISLFNHKGGVSKTTTAFNLGWMLAEQGHKTLIVDADPQCNLTALVLDYNSIEDIEKFYTKNSGCDIASGLKPIMSGKPIEVKAGNPAKTTNENLFLYCGNLELSSFETQISVALTTRDAIPAMRNIPGSINQLIRKTAEEKDFEYIIIDMSPSVGALNQCLLMSSNYFIVPTTPDFFCAQAIKSVARVIPSWNEQIQPFRDSELHYKFPEVPPQFLGFISQRYRPKNGAPATSFKQWIDIIKQTVRNDLIPILEKSNMSIPLATFQKIVETEPYNLANIADFNSLIAQSQKHNVPVFSLTDKQIEQTGTVLSKMEESRNNFKDVFSELAKNVHSLTENLQK